MLLASSSGDRPATRTASSSPASATQTSPSVGPARAPDGTLRLRGAGLEDRRVRWDQDVIDNEGMGKKKSKVCCIYHRPRAYDESSDEDSSSDDSSSDESDSGASSNHGDRSRRCNHHNHNHKKPARKNAYEKMPKPKPGGSGMLKRQT